MGRISEFLFGIYWWTWKTTIYLKNCRSGSIKNVRILRFTMLYLKWNKIKETLGDIIILNMCTKNLDDMIYSFYISMLRYSVWQTEIGNYGPFSALLPPIKTRKIRILKKWKKSPKDIILLHKCTKNHDHMLHCSCDIVRDGYKCYFSFWAIFCPFTPP